jgi:hypothetical protein
MGKSLIEQLRAEHGDGPKLWDALARVLHRAHEKSAGREPDFDALPVEKQERWLDRALRMTA